MLVPIELTNLDVWAERDRTSVILRLVDGSEFKDGPIIAQWWDEEVQRMFDDGFFSAKGVILGKLIDPRPLHTSVYEYCKTHDLLPEDPRLKCADCGSMFGARPGRRVTKRDREYFQCEYCVENDQKARPAELTSAQWRQALRSAKRFQEA